MAGNEEGRMSGKRFTIEPEMRARQTEATDPAATVWVSANAGSGKTHVLTERVVRLLLGGTDPSRILCLTYTRAAAAVMQNRIFERLSAWARLPDAELAAALTDVEGRLAREGELERARRLFALALETPGGLKIQTIHAFCEAILHQFPLEANIAGHFELIDDMTADALLAEARRTLLETAHLGTDTRIASAFADVLEAAGESGLEELISAAIAKRHELRPFLDAVASGSERPVLLEAFGFSEAETQEAIAASAWPLADFPDCLVDTIRAAALREGKESAAKFTQALTEARHASSAQARFDLLVKTFLKEDGEPRSAKNIAAKPIVAICPDLADRFAAACETIAKTADRLALLRLLELNGSALVLIDDLVGRYEGLKRARGLLDFGDLIVRTVSLLAREDAGPWIQYKLDMGIDHILVDEAQDTSPDQWEVIRMLAAEFFAGQGARHGRRTLFAVGDEKQSIYSFQGAVLEHFADFGKAVRRHADGAGLPFRNVSMRHSFRSTWDVLSAVDTVFAEPGAFRGLGPDAGPTQHIPVRKGEPGHVEVWDLFTPTAVQEPEDWREPVDHLAPPAVALAETIAATIRNWLDNKEMLEGQARPIEPKDIMVLVRKRDQFVPALSRALKNLKPPVPVAGADRLRLTDHIAVQDLVALGRFVLQPQDDLSLAALLKSPIFGLSEDALFELAHARGEDESLYERILGEAESDSTIARIAETLKGWRRRVDLVPVHEFYADILGREGARRRLLARLGHEAGDVLDEFQNYALAVERTGLHGLQSFLETLVSGAPEIKREHDAGRNEVRIMTVHAAKGLEAAVVFLVDPGGPAWNASRAPCLLAFDPPGNPAPWQGRGFLWRPSKEYGTRFTDAITADLQRKAEEEYRRLLYVGMTRAEDRLIVCGYRGKKDGGETWHRIVDDALRACDATLEGRHPLAHNLSLRRYRVSPESPASPQAPVGAEEAQAAGELPGLLLLPLATEPGLPRPLVPSGVSAVIEPPAATEAQTTSPVLGEAETSAPGSRKALERGTIIHALLQHLPEIGEGERRAVARTYLDRAASGWSEEERRSIVSSVFSVLEEPGFGHVLAAGSRAEIGVMGEIELGGRRYAVSGKIDRLAVHAGEVLIVDYKTNRPAPRGPEAVPPAYVGQLALYRRLVGPLFPEKVVRTALLFTETPELIEIGPEMLDAALDALSNATRS